MRIAIAGGTGFVGKALTKTLIQDNHEVYILTRKKRTSDHNQLHYIEWLNDGVNPSKELGQIDIFINLAGESINSGRWTEQRKKIILESRLDAAKNVLQLINDLPEKPKALIQASAIGIYGTSETNTFTEVSTAIGEDFLAKTVDAWETVVKNSDLGIRTVFCRFGIILDKDEGALPNIVLPYKLFAGGTIGSGNQWLSWIHIDDVVRAIQFVMAEDEIAGVINFTAPYPVTMKEFGKIIASVLKRPHWIPAPAFALKILLGEMSILVLEGQKVIPQKLVTHRFTFKYPTLKDALTHIYL